MTRTESLMDCTEHTPEMDLLESESLLVHAYEQLTFPIGNPDPIDAILYQMDELGVSKAELAKWVGGKGRLSELLNRTRPLSLPQVKTLSARLDIPVDILLAAAGKN